MPIDGVLSCKLFFEGLVCRDTGNLGHRTKDLILHPLNDGRYETKLEKTPGERMKIDVIGKSGIDPCLLLNAFKVNCALSQIGYEVRPGVQFTEFVLNLNREGSW